VAPGEANATGGPGLRWRFTAVVVYTRGTTRARETGPDALELSLGEPGFIRQRQVLLPHSCSGMLYILRILIPPSVSVYVPIMMFTSTFFPLI
jgi:hypothetical protein